MLVLAVETATPLGSVSLVDEGGVIAERDSGSVTTHSTWLLPAVGELLAEAGVSMRSIDGYAVSVGPGSFTGLRIGLSTVKGLALAAEKPLVGVSTLDALAGLVPRCRYLICPIIDARKKEVYAALYRHRGEEIHRESDDFVLPPGTLADMLAERVLFLGTGGDLYRDVLTESLPGKALFASGRFRYPRAGSVGKLGLRRLAGGQVDPLDRIEPRYVRLSEAELKKAGRHQR